MERTFREALRHRRSYYALAPESPIKHVPSAFNSQSTRAVLLLHEHHDELWKIVKRTLRAIVPEGAFARTEEKIEHSFAAGYGTVLFFEDTDVVRGLQQQFPAYAGNFPVWSEQTSAMHQLAVWTMLVANDAIYQRIASSVWNVMLVLTFAYVVYCVRRSLTFDEKMLEDYTNEIRI